MLIRYFVPLFLSVCSVVHCEELNIRTPGGENLTLDVDPGASFIDVVSQIEFCIQEQEGLNSLYAAQEETSASDSRFRFLFDYFMAKDDVKKTKARDYYAPISAKNQSNIRYIVKTLASSSWYNLLSEKSSLKSAGDEVDNEVHPYCFALFIFQDSELKGAVHSIRERSKIWKEFSSGFIKSFEQESKNNNMKTEYTHNFAKKLGIDVNLILKPVQQKQWGKVLDILLDNVAREGDFKRYD